MNVAQGRKAKIGLLQVSSDYSWTVEQSIEELLQLTEECLKNGADLVFMPEEAQYKTAGSSTRQELIAAYSAGYMERCRELARKYKAYVLPWDYELGENGEVYNTTFVIDRNGDLIGKYRKTQITLNELHKGISCGDDFPVFDLDIGKVGVMICLDNYYPEAATILALRGAELILYPLYGDTMTGRWEIKTRARAIDNSVYVAPCHIHSSPRQSKATYTGMIDPTGEVLCKLEEEGTCQVVEIEMGKPVITEMSGAGRGVYEDMKQMILKLRNTKPFQPLLETFPSKEWAQIRWSERP